MSLTAWFGLGSVGMVLGTVVLAYGFRWIPEADRRRYAILVAVPFIAVVAYSLMALGLGGIESQTGGTVFVPRYVDWVLTTPLHVLYLGLLAGVAKSVLFRAIGLMAATMVFGFVGEVFAPPLTWLFFLAGAATFAGVVYHVFYEFDTAAGERDETTLAVFQKLRAFVVVLWLLYPVIWVLAPVGLGLMDVETTALVVAYLDVVAKVGFGLIALSGQLAATGTGAVDATPAD